MGTVNANTLRLKEFYRKKIGTNLFIFYGVYLVVVTVLIIVNMVHWTNMLSVNDEFGLVPIVTWSGVAGIICVILAVIGMVLSQSVFFLILFIYIELQSIFAAWQGLFHYQSFLIFLIILVGSSIVSGPSYNEFRICINIGCRSLIRCSCLYFYNFVFFSFLP